MKKVKLTNPQIVSDKDIEYSEFIETDYGLLYIKDDALHIVLRDEFGNVVSKKILDVTVLESYKTELNSVVEKAKKELVDELKRYDIIVGYRIEEVEIKPQEKGDKHFENGYDFNNDEKLKNIDYFKKFYKKENGKLVPYNGYDVYYESANFYNYVVYSKLEVKDIIKGLQNIVVKNSDIVIEYGFEIVDNKIYFYCDPEGIMVGKKVLVKYFY
jgi:hypothetical protein